VFPKIGIPGTRGGNLYFRAFTYAFIFHPKMRMMLKAANVRNGFAKAYLDRLRFPIFHAQVCGKSETELQALTLTVAREQDSVHYLISATTTRHST
jgi:hypothetical protein